MLKNLVKILKKNSEIVALTLLVSITIITTTYFTYNKRITSKNYSDLINNIYFKKTLNNIFNNLEPKYKKINHKIKSGETFDKILKLYSINSEEII